MQQAISGLQNQTENDMTGNGLSLGRDHSTADSISITEFTGADPCFRVDIRWNDGAHVYMIHDTKPAALAHVHALGWY
jgi:hypothetical protein